MPTGSAPELRSMLYYIQKNDSAFHFSDSSDNYSDDVHVICALMRFADRHPALVQVDTESLYFDNSMNTQATLSQQHLTAIQKLNNLMNARYCDENAAGDSIWTSLNGLVDDYGNISEQKLSVSRYNCV